MAVNGTPAEATAIGRVVAVNEKGIRFEGAESWSNYSKFAVGIVPPSRGDTVSVTFDRQGFIRAIVPADGRAQPRTALPALTRPSAATGTAPLAGSRS